MAEMQRFQKINMLESPHFVIFIFMWRWGGEERGKNNHNLIYYLSYTHTIFCFGAFLYLATIINFFWEKDDIILLCKKWSNFYAKLDTIWNHVHQWIFPASPGSESNDRVWLEMTCDTPRQQRVLFWISFKWLANFHIWSHESVN